MANSLRYDDFARYLREAHAMQNSVGQVQGVDDLQIRDTAVDPLKGKRLRDFTGFTFFTLGTCYEMVGIDQDVIGAYDADTSERFTVLTHHFKLPIIAAESGWSYVLQGLETPVFENFKAWFERLGFRTYKPDGVTVAEYWGARGYPVTVQDPLAREERALEGADPAIWVFCPRNTKYTVLPVVHAGVLPVRFARGDVDPQLLREARGLFDHETTEAEYIKFQQTGETPV